MDRRTFNKLAGMAALGALAESPDAPAQSDSPGVTDGPANAAGEVLLEDDVLLVAFDRGSGALTRLVRKTSGWTIQRRPELGLSLRLFAPLPGRRDNFVLPQDQRATLVQKVSDSQIRLQWRDLVSQYGGVLDITFNATVSLNRGQLLFESELINNSPLMVETIDYPYLGDLNSPSPESTLNSEHLWYGNLVGGEIHPTFRNEHGYWGVRCPLRTIDSKQSLLCLLQAPEQGLYTAMHDPTQPYLLQFTFEQHPGVLDSIDNQVPAQDSIGGIPVCLEFRTCHFVFAHPRSQKKLAPVAFEPYSGDWHAGIDVYKRWRANWFRNPAVPAWVKDVHSWQQLQINTPEQDWSIPYLDLKPYIDECVACGVRAIQLVGWNKGGQDGGDPAQDISPGLGTWLELHDAIAYAQSKGVRMILFAKLSWADMTTEWFRTELCKYTCTDPWQIPYETDGYSYLTPTQLAGINNHRRQIMDFLCPAYQRIAAQQFEKILALGSAGWLYDEVCHHGPVEYSFSPTHGYVPPGYIYNGDMPVAAMLRAAADKIDPDFVFAGEGPQDWLMQHYPVSYFRIDAGSRAVNRYIDSYAPLMVAVTGFDDREMLNLILMNRYIISYEPYNFKGKLSNFPMTVAYGRKIDALRERYRDFLWDAEFHDSLGATIHSDGFARHSVFVAASGKRAVVVVNNDAQRSIHATVDLPNAGRLAVVTPENPDPSLSSGTLDLPPRSAAVLLER
ncbi:MAG: hypothetical protein WBG54_07520 [Acidobacteriaceae bacterium]